MKYLELREGLRWDDGLGEGCEWSKEYKEYRSAIEKTAGEIQALARKNQVNVNREYVGCIMYAIGLTLSSFSLDETRKLNEFSRLFLALHTGKQIKVGRIEICSFKENFMDLACGYLAKWFQEELHPLIKAMLSIDVDRVLDGDICELNRLVKISNNDLLFIESNEKKKCKILARRICEILHPDYMNYREWMPKNEVCFIYDILVYANLREDDGVAAPDDKYDAIKRFIKKKQEDGGGYSYAD